MNVDIRAYLKHLKVRRKSAHQFVLVRPEREWLLGLLCAGILFLGCSVFAGYLFYTTADSIERGPQLQIESTQVYAREAVEHALTTYREKQKAFDALRSSVAPLPAEPEGEGAPTTEEGGPEETPVLDDESAVVQ